MQTCPRFGELVSKHRTSSVVRSIGPHYPPHYLGDIACRYTRMQWTGPTYPQFNRRMRTFWTPLLRTLNPQVSGSNPEGRTRKSSSERRMTRIKRIEAGRT